MTSDANPGARSMTMNIHETLGGRPRHGADQNVTSPCSSPRVTAPRVGDTSCKDHLVVIHSRRHPLHEHFMTTQPPVSTPDLPFGTRRTGPRSAAHVRRSGQSGASSHFAATRLDEYRCAVLRYPTRRFGERSVRAFCARVRLHETNVPAGVISTRIFPVLLPRTHRILQIGEQERDCQDRSITRHATRSARATR
jgi:hypothetical protein